MNVIKKIVGALTFTLLTFLLVMTVEAKEVCKEYTNYYLFAEINGSEGVEGNVNSSTDGWYRQHKTFFPQLPKEDEGRKKDSVKKTQVCLTKSNGTSNCASTTGKPTLSLKEFYEKWKLVASSPDSEIKFNSTNTGDTTTYKEYKEDNVSWLLHGKWFEVNSDGTRGNASGEGTIDYTSATSITDLENGSILCPTTINLNDETTNYNDATIARTITSSHLNGVTPFNMKWSNGTADTAYLTPALYKITYEMCEDAPEYNATIEYVYKDGKDLVEFKDGSKNPYTESGLVAGYTSTVTSPELEGCTPDKEKVDIVIDKENPENFKAVVEYTCNPNEQPVEENPNTADLNIILLCLVIVGSAVVGVATYREKKLNSK